VVAASRVVSTGGQGTEQVFPSAETKLNRGLYTHRADLQARHVVRVEALQRLRAAGAAPRPQAWRKAEVMRGDCREGSATNALAGRATRLGAVEVVAASAGTRGCAPPAGLLAAPRAEEGPRDAAEARSMMEAYAGV